MKLYKNATFITCEPENKLYTAMVEDKGFIAWIGDEKNIPDAYRNAPAVDLKGATVTPAFGDTHMHFSCLCLCETTFYLMEEKNFKECEQTVRHYADTHPKAKVLLGFGCNANCVEEKRVPVRADLDSWTDRPLFVYKYDGHAGVCNTAMLNLFTDKVKQARGFNEETGWLFGEAFYLGTNEVTGFVNTFDILRSLGIGADYLASRGIGMVHNVEGIGFANDLDVDLMKWMCPGLPQAYRTFFQTMDIDTCKKHGYKRIGGCFRLALDGCFGSEDAALKQPYANNPSNSGILNYTQQQVNDFVIRANREGLQITIHAIGDAAVEQCITAYEAAYADKPWTDARHIMIHVCLASEEQLKRMAKIKICAAVQSPFIYWKQEPDEYLCSVLGRERTDSLNKFGTMHKVGLVVGDGSDGPCTRPNPLRGMHCAVNNPIPEERVTREQALKMITYNPAYISKDEATRGSLTPGKIADFVVLGDNPLTAEDIEHIEVRDLYLHGKRYKRGALSPMGLVCKAVGNRIFGRKFL